MIPSLVQKQGLSLKGKSPNTRMIAILVADTDASGQPLFDNLFLSNYATIQIRDELTRLPTVADVTFMGQRDYSMRIWLDPEKLASLDLTATDIVNAINDQNAQVAAGQIGQQPEPPGGQQQPPEPGGQQ